MIHPYGLLSIVYGNLLKIYVIHEDFYGPHAKAFLYKIRFQKAYYAFVRVRKVPVKQYLYGFREFFLYYSGAFRVENIDHAQAYLGCKLFPYPFQDYLCVFAYARYGNIVYRDKLPFFRIYLYRYRYVSRVEVIGRYNLDV